MRRLAIIAVTALLLAGCTSGSDDDTSPPDGKGTSTATPTPSATRTTVTPTGPACDDVWKPGETLPADYESCVTDGQFGEQDVTPCEDGSQLIVFGDELYAVTGSTIVEPKESPLQDTTDYGNAFTACTGEQ